MTGTPVDLPAPAAGTRTATSSATSSATPFTVAGLRARYVASDDPCAEVADVVAQVHARIAARGEDGTWISLVPPTDVARAVARLDPADRSRLPLWGVPFAVKDNLDTRGLPTTAACPGFAYEPEETAVAVARLEAAGALLIGKTNLDQFATGLNGTRSPYGVPRHVHDPALVPGGSSSGSAVAVAAGQVPFSLGTDTAGSGRVPAALQGVVGLKPSIGLVSTRGLLPACRSLDCVSVFTQDVADAAAVLHVLAGHDPDDPWSRPLDVPAATPQPVEPGRLRLAVPAAVRGWGARGEQAAWEATLERLRGAGVTLVPLPADVVDDLHAAGDQLYTGPWLAERAAGLTDFLTAHRDAVWPAVAGILDGATAVTGVEVFAGLDAMAQRRRRVRALLADVDALLTPTVTETFTVAELQADPVALNARLGRWTTFTNLLDLAAIAVPGVPGAPGGSGGPLPFGVTVQAPAGSDGALAGVAATLEAVLRGGAPTPVEPPLPPGLDVAVVGAHLEGMPLHADLLGRGARLRRRTRTAPVYRFYALPGTVPPKPGLRRVAAGDRTGTAIEVEVYRLPWAEVGGFLATVVAPLAIGQVELEDGVRVHGFVCEPWALADAEDITGFGGWRAYLAAR
ncbi:allophanate hydrolase [Nocardioides sp.]|uniref:allophanate hydrolase n=1 Tax=Nocardioides sp. TaxID=35761 RepID=UPI0035183CE0